MMSVMMGNPIKTFSNQKFLETDYPCGRTAAVFADFIPVAKENRNSIIWLRVVHFDFAK